MTHTRRVLLGAAATLAAGVPSVGQVLAQVRDGGRSPPGPLRIGCITALSGPQEVIGRPILDGAGIAADQVNAMGGVLGRPVEIVPVDIHADPALGQAAVRDLARLGVNLMCGIVTSDVGLAVAPLLAPANAVMMVCSAQTEKLTHEAFTPNLFRITDQTYMRNRAQARLMAERYPDVTDWGAIAPDVEYGRSAYAAFRDGLMEYYPKLARREATFAPPILADFGATDFSQQLAKLKAGGHRGLFVAVYGGDAVGLYRQAREAGLMQQVQVLADSYNEFLVPLELGGMTPEHLWLAMTWYYGGYRSAVSHELYADYVRRTGNAMPPGFVSTGHAAVHAYAKAVRLAGSSETKPVIKALEGMMLDTAKGTLTFRAQDHQAVCDVDFVRIKSGPELGMDVLDGTRSDVEVAEFVRYNGADVIEPAAPGRAISYRVNG